ncbi:hypothetical protein KPH14_007014 [Odynerus spinipes]|uniref:Chitin-binding type-2 domain-containing protein n=1 Tax=Odynerus spinipes TaxID=1348599 RepID=A0AAD9RRR3_9HYME|nr:hypothetical protein KPH14_007014 [Odynerus spinipes]
MRACTAESNVTQSSFVEEEEEDEALSDITFAEFKERYRRLIPYMAFYVANNHLNAQSLPVKNFVNVPSNSVPSRRPYQYTFPRINAGTRNGANNYRTSSNVQNQLRKFIPSVQYDPSDISGDNNYFTPIRYRTKINHVDYPTSSYSLYQDQKLLHTEATNPPGQTLAKDYRYGRPIRPYVSNGGSSTREYVHRNQAYKPIQTSLQQDYGLDHVSGPNGKPFVEVNYPGEEIDLRYIPPVAVKVQQPQQQPIKILDSPGGRQPVNVVPQRNPLLNLNPLIESFQLSERLPEALTKYNLNDSIKTLVEILNILHNAKKEEFPQLPQPPLSPLAPIVRPIQQRPPGYYTKPSRPNTRPKVITESRYPAVPTSLLIPDDPDRFKPTPSYADEVKPKVATPPAYASNDFKPTPSYDDNEFHVTPKIPVQTGYTVVDQDNGKKIEQFHRPSYVQNIRPDNEDSLKYTVNQQDLESSTQHSYEITEDLSDDIIDQQRFTIPHIPTEVTTQSSVKQNKISTSRPKIAQTSLKYGATRGKPNIDYPAYATIPETDFSCKEQRYKGFFGDPATDCQVWHYCDLNGGKASFLCPNGTIFSQVALTCDWWFNVKCESTTQLYVLNERLYKYILPIMPKFPEDFTGPEVDRYLEVKFKEMEAKLKEKKLKKQQERKEKAKGKAQPPVDDNPE